MHIKRGHAQRLLHDNHLRVIVEWWFLCILLVANENSMHLKLTAAQARGLSFPRAHAPLYIGGWKERRFQLKHRYVASLILHANIAEITAQLFSSSYV